VVGAVASFTGPQVVMIVAPIVAVSIVIALLHYSYRSLDQGQLAVRDALDLLTADDDDQTSIDDTLER
jgi:hypothetical protein